MNRKLAPVIMIVSIPIVWLLAIELTDFKPFILPHPMLVAQVLIEEWRLLWLHARITLLQASVGCAAANCVAFAAAVAFLYVEWLRWLATPWLVLIRNVPFVAFSSILIILLGDSLLAKTFVVVLITYFPLLEALNTGLRSPDQVLLDRMRVLNANTWQVFLKIRLPAAVPYYLTALRFTLPSSIMAAIVAQWLYSRHGLGFLIQQSVMRARADRLYAVVLVAATEGLGFYFAGQLLEWRTLRWKRA